jgi:glycosyltransferase involved in cell wall biosynthesis
VALTPCLSAHPEIRPIYVSGGLRRRRIFDRVRMYYDYIAWQRAAARHMAADGAHYDLAHHVTWASLHFGTRLMKVPNLPLVVGPIGGGNTAPSAYLRYFGSRNNEYAERIRTLATLGARFFPAVRRLRKADFVFASNFDTERILRRLGVSPTSCMVPDGIYRAAVASQPRESPPPTQLILWVGRMAPHKAPDLAVRAFGRLLQTCPDARVRMVGGGEMLEDVRATVSELGIGASVEITGQVPHDQLMEYYDGAYLLLFTSLRDAFGAQCLEAAARALPLVVLNHQGAGDLIPSPAAMKVELLGAGSIETRLATACIRLLEDDHLWRRASAASLEFARENTWERKVASAEVVYHRVLTHRIPSRPDGDTA